MEYQEGDIVKHKILNRLYVVCSNQIDKLTGEWTVYYPGSPVLGGMYPENMILQERTVLPWRQAASKLKADLGIK